ncbi:hypothetical protein D3C75_1069690 [compost metagenome]
MPPVAQTKKDHPRAQHEHYSNGNHLDHGEPKFEFSIELHRRQIRRRDNPYTCQFRQPLRNPREPVAHIDPDCRNFRHAYRNPQEPVTPCGHEARKRMNILVSKRSERTGHRFQHQHFPHNAHNKKHDDSRQQISQQH